MDFNGSSADYLCKHFTRDFSAEKCQLTKNYRSSKCVIQVANNLKPGSQDRNTSALKGRIEIESLTDEVEESKWIVSSIKKLISDGQHNEIEGEISLNHMVVIARNRFVFSTLQKILKEHSIPFFLKKAERATEPVSTLGKILDYGMRIKLNPRNWVDGKKLCCLLGIESPEEWQDQNFLKLWSDEIDTPRDPLETVYSASLLAVHELDPSEPNMRKFKESLYKKLNKLAVSGANDAQEIERSIEELEEFYENWIIFKRKGLGISLRSFQHALALGQLVEEDTMVTGDRLMLSTVHTMKGLEKGHCVFHVYVRRYFP